MKTPSNELFELVRSLNPQEKKYFKQYYNYKGNDDHYSVIFDAVSAQGTYDEARLKRALEPSASRNLKQLKSQLYERILQCLRHLHSGKTVQGKIRELMDQAEVLLHKKQFQACLKITEKARKMAVACESFSYAYELAELKERTMQRMGNTKWLEENQPVFFEDQNELLDQLKNHNRYRKAASHFVNVTTRKGHVRDKKLAAEYKQIISDPLWKKESSARSVRARSIFYTVNAAYHYYSNDNKKSFAWLLKLKKLIDEHPALKDRDFQLYLFTINNMLNTGMGSLPFENMVAEVGSLKDLKPYSHAEHADVLIRYYGSLMRMFIVYARYPEAIESVKEAEAWLKENNKYSPSKPHSLIALINIAILWFCNGEYRKCLASLNQALNFEEQDTLQDRHSFARIFNLIVHFELGNEELLPHITLSTYRYLYKRNRLYKLETLVLDFIRRKAPLLGQGKERVEAFRELKNNIIKITSKDPFEKQALSYFDFLSWIDSKIEGRKFVA